MATGQQKKRNKHFCSFLKKVRSCSTNKINKLLGGIIVEQTDLSICTFDSRAIIRRAYHSLKSNDQIEIMKFIFTNGFSLKYGFTEDTHDIGDQEWDSSSFSEVDGLLKSLSNSFGECKIQARFCGEEIKIYKPYPNIYHGLDFIYKQSLDEKLQPFFAAFEKNFCYEDIQISRRSKD